MASKHLKILSILFILGLISVAYACAEQPRTLLSSSEVAEFNKKASVAPETLLQSQGTDIVDVATEAKSSITFFGKAFKLGQQDKSDANIDHDHWGGFKTWEGKALLDPSTKMIKALAFRVQMDSTYSDLDKGFSNTPSTPRDKREKSIKDYKQNTNFPGFKLIPTLLTKHLKNYEMLDAKTFPYSLFQSTSIKQKSGDTYEVEGDLLFRGYKTHKKFDAKITSDPSTHTIHATAEMNIKLYEEAHFVYTGLESAPMDTNVAVFIDLTFQTQ